MGLSKFLMQGRISTIKWMFYLVYIFCSLWFPLLLHLNISLKCMLSFPIFVWGGKRARIKLTTLQRSKLTGGLAVPNLDFYYYAFQIRSFQVWRHQDSQVPWRAIEAARVKPHRLEDLPYTGTNVQLRYGSIMVNSLNVWRKTEKTV